MIIDLNRENYSYEDYISDAKALVKQYNNIIQYVTIGESHDNRDIVMLRLGTGRKYILLCGGVHGRETINTMDGAEKSKADKYNKQAEFARRIANKLNQGNSK